MFRIIFLILFLFSPQIYAGFNELNKVELNDLTFKEVMRAFYGRDLVHGAVTEVDFDELMLNPHLSIDEVGRKNKKNSTLLKEPEVLKNEKDFFMPSTQKYYGAYLGDIREYKNINNSN